MGILPIGKSFSEEIYCEVNNQMNEIMDQPHKINEGILVPNYSFYKTKSYKCPRMKKEQFKPYNYK